MTTDTGMRMNADASQRMSTDEGAVPPGEQLRIAREGAGLTQEDIASKLKLSPRQISAIETGDWSALPERTFTRGFMRNYARLVSVDPDSLGLDQSSSQPHAATELKPTPAAIGEIAYDEQSRSARFARWMVPLALAAILVAGVVYVQWGHLLGLSVPTLGKTAASAAGAVKAPVAATSANTQEASTTSSGSVIAPATPPLLGTPASPAADAVAGAAPVLIQSPALSPPSGTAAPATTTAAPPTPVLLPPLAKGDKRISITFKGKSWTEVRSKGDVIFSESAEPGNREFTGTPPLSFTIGNASNVSIAIDGKPYDLTDLTRNDVARFRIE